MNELERKSIEILKTKDPRFYIDMIDPLSVGIAKAIYADEDGVLIKASETWMWMANNVNKAKEIAKIIKGEKEKNDGFCAHDNIGLKEVSEILDGAWYNVPCYVAARFSKEPYQINSDLVFKTLDHTYDSFVHQTYGFIKNDPNGIEYAKERIDATMYGGFINGKCIGFIGTHPEGTMGLLEILPEYRKHGYGLALEQYLANEFIKQNRYPFCHILETNSASIKLQEQLGMWLSDNRRVYWMD